MVIPFQGQEKHSLLVLNFRFALFPGFSMRPGCSLRRPPRLSLEGLKISLHLMMFPSSLSSEPPRNSLLFPYHPQKSRRMVPGPFFAHPPRSVRGEILKYSQSYLFLGF